jgi:hypothetical protein
MRLLAWAGCQQSEQLMATLAELGAYNHHRTGAGGTFPARGSRLGLANPQGAYRRRQQRQRPAEGAHKYWPISYEIKQLLSTLRSPCSYYDTGVLERSETQSAALISVRIIAPLLRGTRGM